MTPIELQTELNQESRDYADLGKFKLEQITDNEYNIVLEPTKHLKKLYKCDVIRYVINKNEIIKANAFTVDELLDAFRQMIICS